MASLLWASRVFLMETMFNFPVVIIIGVILSFLFFIISSHFNSILHEYGDLYYSFQLILFSTLPLISSSFISWFICVEVPSFNVELCYSLIYFCYVKYLAEPRFTIIQKTTSSEAINNNAIKSGQNSNKNNVEPKEIDEQVILIPKNLLFIIYSIPIITNFLIHIAVHHNTIRTLNIKIIDILMSILFPTFLMLLCATKQLVEYYKNDENKSTLYYLDFFKFHIGASLLIWLQNHPVFDEILSFSGLDSPYPRILLISVFLLVYLGYVLFNYTKNNTDLYSEEDSANNNNFLIYNEKLKMQTLRSSLLKTLITACIALATTLLAILVNIPYSVLPFSTLGAITITEFYHRKNLSEEFQILLVMVTVVSIFVISVSFSMNTVFFIEYFINWGVGFDMQQFCIIFAVLLSICVALPTSIVRINLKNYGDVFLLPFESDNYNKFKDANFFKGAFQFLFLFIALALAAFELMLREHVFFYYYYFFYYY
jgi:hypothetical protein